MISTFVLPPIMFQTVPGSIIIHPAVFAAIITIIIGIIGYLVGRLTASNETQRKISENVVVLSSSVTKIELIVQGMQELNTNFVKNCDERHEGINNEIHRLRDKVES